MKSHYWKKLLLVVGFLVLSPSVALSQTTKTTTVERDDMATPTPVPQEAAPTEQKSENKGGLFVEPFLTYENGDVEIDYPSPFGSSTETLEGFGLGARLGFHIHEIVFIAADGRYSQPTYDSEALGDEGDSKAYNLGATLGLQTPVAGLRVWGTYIFDGQLDPDKINGVNAKFSELQGYRIGAGFYVSKVSLNLEYQNAEYDKTTLEEVGTITGGNVDSIDAKIESYILSVSFPIAI